MKQTVCIRVISLFISLLLCTIHNSTYSMMPGMGPGGMGELSPAEQQMLEQMERELNEFINTLPPEEQKKFWQDVEEVQQKMSQMSEDELVDFINQALTEEGQSLPPAAPAAAPMPPPAMERPVEKPAEPIPVSEVKPIVAPKRQQDAIDALSRITTSLNNFLRKAQIIADLPMLITEWGVAGKLTGWDNSLSWLFLKGFIEELDQRLAKVQDRDPKTAEYKYLNTLILDDTLYNQIIRLGNLLSTNESAIEIPVLGIEPLSPRSEQAIIAIINGVIEAHGPLKLLTSLDNVIAGYDPIAKARREAEEAAQKAAAERARTPFTPTQAKVVGRPERPSRELGRERPAEPFYPPFQPPEFPGRFEAPRYEPEERFREEARPAVTPPAPAKPPEKKPEREEDKIAEGYVSEIARSMDTLMATIESNKKFTELRSYLLGADPIDEGFISDVNSAISTAKEAAQALTLLKRRIGKLKTNQKREYKKDVKGIEKDYKKEFDRALGKLRDIVDDKSAIGNMPPEKQWAFFGIIPKDEKVREKIRPLVSGTVALSALYDQLKRIQEVVKDIDKIKAA